MGVSDVLDAWHRRYLAIEEADAAALTDYIGYRHEHNAEVREKMKAFNAQYAEPDYSRAPAGSGLGLSDKTIKALSKSIAAETVNQMTERDIALKEAKLERQAEEARKTGFTPSWSHGR